MIDSAPLSTIPRQYNSSVNAFSTPRNYEPAPVLIDPATFPQEIDIRQSLTRLRAFQRSIRLVPDLSATALKQRATNCLILWHQLRYLNASGSGVLTYSDAIESLEFNFRYSRATIYRRLDAGEGRFWKRYTNKAGRHVIKMSSLDAVLKILGVNLTEKHFREVAPSEFSGLKHCRALLYASTHKPAGVRANPISRQSIERRTGLQKRQQRRYETVPGVKVQRITNYAIFNFNGKYVSERQEIHTKTSTYFVNKQLPNSYRTGLAQSAQGMLKKIRNNSLGSLEEREAPTKLKRVFFSTELAMVKAAGNKSVKDMYLLPKGLRRITGRLEWVTGEVMV